MTLLATPSTQLLSDEQIDDLARQAADWSIRRAPSSVNRDDLVQEARIAIWAAAERWDASRGNSLRSWVLLRAYGACIDAIRRVPDPQIFIVLDFDALMASKPASDHHVEDAVRRLPSESRTVITLLFFTGFTCDEAARVLRISPTLVKRRRDAALVRLRTMIEAA